MIQVGKRKRVIRSAAVCLLALFAIVFQAYICFSESASLFTGVHMLSCGLLILYSLFDGPAGKALVTLSYGSLVTFYVYAVLTTDLEPIAYAAILVIVLGYVVFIAAGFELVKSRFVVIAVAALVCAGIFFLCTAYPVYIAKLSWQASMEDSWIKFEFDFANFYLQRIKNLTLELITLSYLVPSVSAVVLFPKPQDMP